MANDRYWMVRQAAIAVEFVSPIIGGAVAGYLLDNYFHTRYLTLIMFLVGVFAGFYRLILTLRGLNKQPDQGR
jgi:F0F1-type ATP synthase assembly protein I